MSASRSAFWAREELLSLLSVCGNLAGLCITVVALMHTIDANHGASTIVDEILAVCAAAFLICIYLIFWALRTHGGGLSALLIRIVNGVFLVALTMMTAAAFVMVYTLW